MPSAGRGRQARVELLSSPAVTVYTVSSLSTVSIMASMSSTTGSLGCPGDPHHQPAKRPLEEEPAKLETGGNSKKYKTDLSGLPTRQYLDQTVVPILLQVAQPARPAVCNAVCRAWLVWRGSDLATLSSTW